VLSDVESYAYQEIADITGLPLGTVKSRLSRARSRLRDCLRAVRELLPAEYRLMDE
jgi:RNA polymerase sigma-70 factor (ECF subfamily)